MPQFPNTTGGPEASFIDDRRILLSWYDDPAEFAIVQFADALERGQLAQGVANWTDIPMEEIPSRRQKLAMVQPFNVLKTAHIFVDDCIHEIRHFSNAAYSASQTSTRQPQETQRARTCIDRFAMVRGILPTVALDPRERNIATDGLTLDIDYRSYTASIGPGITAESLSKRTCILSGRVICFRSYDPSGLLRLLVIDVNPRRSELNANDRAGRGALDTDYTVGACVKSSLAAVDVQRRRYEAGHTTRAVTMHREALSPTFVSRQSDRPPSEELWKIQLPDPLERATSFELSTVDKGTLVVHGERREDGEVKAQRAWCFVF